MKKLLPLLFLLLSTAAFSQQTCTQKLNQAEDDYEAGRLLNIPDLIDACMSTPEIEGGFSKEEQIRARKLLTLVYIFTDQQGKAEGALVNLLRADPEHRLNPKVDPAELFYLYEQFRVAPIFRIGFKAGVNISKVNVIQEYTTRNGLYDNTFYNGKETGGIGEFQSGLGIGFNVEATIERHLFDGFEVAGGFQWRLSEFNVDNEEIFAEDFTVTTLRTSMTHQQMYLRTPLLIRYSIGYENYLDRIFIPYFFIGGSYDYLLRASYSNGERSPGITFNVTDLNSKDREMVKPYNFSLMAGIGTKIRVNTHFITVEARYNNSLINYTNPENRYSNSQESIFDAAYVEDDLVIDFISFSVGYTHSIYNPKKLKVFRD